MFKCISNSIMEDAHLKIITEMNTYTRHGAEAGPILFKLLMQKAIIDTCSTTNYFHENLSSLDTYMASINLDIVEFNKYVKLNHNRLIACGEGCDNILVNLFKGYTAAGNDNFVKYMADHRTYYNDGNDDTMPEHLMSFALNKYTNLTCNKQWGALLPNQKKIVALTAKVKNNNFKLSKILSSSKEGSNKSNKGKYKGKKDKKGKSKKPKIADKYKWKTVPPKDSNPTRMSKVTPITSRPSTTRNTTGASTMLPGSCMSLREMVKKDVIFMNNKTAMTLPIPDATTIPSSMHLHPFLKRLKKMKTNSDSRGRPHVCSAHTLSSWHY